LVFKGRDVHEPVPHLAAQFQKARPNPLGTPSLQCCLTDLPALGQLVLGDEKSVHVDVLALPLSGLQERAVRQKSQALSKIFPISNDGFFCDDIALKVPVRDICVA
jgi:hypothetical protein